MKAHHVRGWLKQRRLLLLILVAIVIIAYALVAAYDRFVDSTMTLNKTSSAVLSSTIDAQITQLHHQQHLEYLAAAKTASEARTVTPATADTLTCHNLLTRHGQPDAIDVLVNKSHCLSPINYESSDLVTLDGFLLSAKAAPHLQAMFAAAATAGVPLSLTSAYRSFDNQVATYSGWASTNGSTDLADTVSARPGYSEHQTGLAVDLKASNCALECFATTPQYAWLQQHAAEYGFIQRYQKGFETITGYSAEPWHYRYVGTDTAMAMKTSGIHTLEEYWHISGGNYPN